MPMMRRDSDCDIFVYFLVRMKKQCYNNKSLFRFYRKKYKES